MRYGRPQAYAFAVKNCTFHAWAKPSHQPKSADKCTQVSSTWSLSTKVHDVLQKYACSSFDHGVGEVFLLVLVHFTEDLDALETMSSARHPRLKVEPVCFHV